MDNYQDPMNRGLIDDDSYLKVNTNSESCIDNLDYMMKIDNDKINYVSVKENKDFKYLNNSIYYKNNLVIKNVNNKFLIGKHNKTNLLLAIAICHKLGLSFEQIDKVINKIKPVKYRLEYIKSINGVDVYNDGKSTTPSSVKASIESFENKKIHLILGGRNKGMDFSCLKNYDNVHFYVYGEVKDDLSVLLNSKKYNTFKEAYRDINAKKGEIVIYSPGCASFDQFKDYIERSKAFETMILNE
jgi:UDP-N-acetylmuramoylalanine--D-glutamate ligase